MRPRIITVLRHISGAVVYGAFLFLMMPDYRHLYFGFAVLGTGWMLVGAMWCKTCNKYSYKIVLPTAVIVWAAASVVTLEIFDSPLSSSHLSYPAFPASWFVTSLEMIIMLTIIMVPYELVRKYAHTDVVVSWLKRTSKDLSGSAKKMYERPTNSKT